MSQEIPLSLPLETITRMQQELTTWMMTTDIDGDNAVAMADLLRDVLRAIPTVPCTVCHQFCIAAVAHRHQGGWIGHKCCWDERLRASE